MMDGRTEKCIEPKCWRWSAKKEKQKGFESKITTAILGARQAKASKRSKHVARLDMAICNGSVATLVCGSRQCDPAVDGGYTILSCYNVQNAMYNQTNQYLKV